MINSDLRCIAILAGDGVIAGHIRAAVSMDVDPVYDRLNQIEGHLNNPEHMAQLAGKGIDEAVKKANSQLVDEIAKLTERVTRQEKQLQTLNQNVNTLQTSVRKEHYDKQLEGRKNKKFVRDLGALNMGPGTTTAGQQPGKNASVAQAVADAFRAKLKEKFPRNEYEKVIQDVYVFYPSKTGRVESEAGMDHSGGSTAVVVARPPPCIITFRTDELAAKFHEIYKKNEADNNIIPARLRLDGFSAEDRRFRSMIFPLKEAGKIKMYGTRPAIDRNTGKISMECEVKLGDGSQITTAALGVQRDFMKRNPKEFYKHLASIAQLGLSEADAEELAKKVRFAQRPEKSAAGGSSQPARSQGPTANPIKKTK